MTEFSTNESTSLEKPLELSENPVKTSEHELEDVYELAFCENWVKSNKFSKVCLQFPDHLLPDSYRVSRILKEKLGFHVHILADTSYGSCCIDYVAAGHVGADSIIHYGPVCSSPNSETIPSLIISEKKHLNFDEIYDRLSEISPRPVILVDKPYQHIYSKITKVFDSCQVDKPDNCNVKNCDVLFLTDCQRKLLDVKLKLKPKSLYYWSDTKHSIVLYDDDVKQLKRRHFLIEKIKDCHTLGIVVGTLAVKNYLTVIERMKKLATLHRKKFYLLSVGKPTVAKLANFPEIDVYVIISCALNETSDSRDYYKTMVTPYDVEMALNPSAPSDWSTFSHDFNDWLTNPIGDDVTPVYGDVSLITGQVRVTDVTESSDSSTVISTRQSSDVAIGHHGAGFLANRSWRGLEPNLGEGDVTMATEGRTGIAQCYNDET